MNENYSGRMSLNDWSSLFMESIVSDDLSGELVESFLRHLADLGTLIPCADDLWEWADYDSINDSENLIGIIQKNLEALCFSEEGFALPYFIGYKKLNRKPLISDERLGDPESESRKKDANLKGRELSQVSRPASDLSNLQIVKKVGKQLQPFLKIEESVVSRLTGKYAVKQDAQKLFHYIFGKMNVKAEPRAWEQISRKRHR